MIHAIRVSTVLLLVVVLSASEARAQPADPDSFAVWMRAAWKEAGQANFPDSLQRAYGQAFFDFYQQHPQTETGGEAGWQAFLLWANAGAATEVDAALSQLGNDSELWSYILPYVENAYAASGDRGTEDAYALLKDLEGRLTHPASKSAVLLHLARHYQAQDEQDQAQALFQEIVNLNARPFFVDQALGALYEAESLNLRQQAPLFTAQTVKGDTVALADFQGQHVLVVFWATWCAPCMPEIPRLKALWSAHHDQGLQIIGVALDGDDGREAVEPFIEEKEMGWPQVVESPLMDGEIARLYNIVGIPNTYLIGPDGAIVAKNLRGEELEEKIQRLMDAPEEGDGRDR